MSSIALIAQDGQPLLLIRPYVQPLIEVCIRLSAWDEPTQPSSGLDVNGAAKVSAAIERRCEVIQKPIARTIRVASYPAPMVKREAETICTSTSRRSADA